MAMHNGRYEDVRVPVENMMGHEDRGFECIMHNFNHERHAIFGNRRSISGNRRYILGIDGARIRGPQLYSSECVTGLP